jgi:glycerol kinase
MCVHGTGSFVDLVIGPQAPANPGLYDATVTTPGWRREGRSHFAVETYAAATGSALNHLCSELRWFESARQIGDLAATVASAEGLFFLPALTGLRQPRILPEARASLTGLSLAHGRPHLAYAILEGIAHLVVACGEASEESAGIRLQEIVAGGGLSSSDVLLGIQADLSGVPVRRMADAKHASLRGAAFLAGSGGLFWSDLSEARATLPEGDLFEPRISAQEREERRSRWKTIVSEEIQRVSAGMHIRQEQEC